MRDRAGEAMAFYRREPGSRSCVPMPVRLDLDLRMWRPTTRQVAPPSFRSLRWGVWWILHHLRIFGNRSYTVAVVYDGSVVVHRSGLFPYYSRFPFMSREDVQVGDVWTAPAYRGQGIASWAIGTLLAAPQVAGRQVWYVAPCENRASRRVAENIGFDLVGYGRRRPRLGLGVLGTYVIDGWPMGPSEEEDAGKGDPPSGTAEVR